MLVVGKMSSRTRFRPWRQCLDPYQPLRTRGDAGSTRWRSRAPTSPYGDGTSPTVPDGAHSRRRWAGRTSIRDTLEVWLPCTGPYPRSWGAAGPVGGALGGARRARRILPYCAVIRGGKGLNRETRLPTGRPLTSKRRAKPAHRVAATRIGVTCRFPWVLTLAAMFAPDPFSPPQHFGLRPLPTFPDPTPRVVPNPVSPGGDVWQAEGQSRGVVRAAVVGAGKAACSITAGFGNHSVCRPRTSQRAPCRVR